MDWSILLKVGVLVDVTTKDGKKTTGYLDEVGITPHEKKILVANQLPSAGGVFRGRRINIEDISDLQLSAAGKADF